jgi:hypothetical protein
MIDFFFFSVLLADKVQMDDGDYSDDFDESESESEIEEGKFTLFLFTKVFLLNSGCYFFFLNDMPVWLPFRHGSTSSGDDSKFLGILFY